MSVIDFVAIMPYYIGLTMSDDNEVIANIHRRHHALDHHDHDLHHHDHHDHDHDHCHS